MNKFGVSTKNFIRMWLILLFVAALDGVFVHGDSSIPHLCDNIRCPPLSDINCPIDSDIRELIPEPLIAEDELLNKYPVVDIYDEIFAQCCLSQKCQCKTCYIPDCEKDGEVVVELLPESMDTPGHCCGTYQCQKEPNCTVVQNTDSYWLTNCQRCKCIAGQSICHQSCDEAMKKPSAICHSKSLNRFFEHGKTWRDGCQECECVNGEPNCLINFCRGVNCPPHRQVTLKDSCCPVCWPKGYPMPNAGEEYDDDEGESGHHYDDTADHDYIEQDDNIEPNIELKPINEIDLSATSTSSSSNTSTTTTTTEAPLVPSNSTTTSTNTTTETIVMDNSETTTASTTTSAPVTSQTSTLKPCKTSNDVSSGTSTTTVPQEPCDRQNSPANYQVYPQVVELMRYSQHNDLLYTIIGCLSVIVVLLAAWNIHLKAKQRSYRPVSNLDDNFNTMTSNIKKMNDYV